MNASKTPKFSIKTPKQSDSELNEQEFMGTVVEDQFIKSIQEVNESDKMCKIRRILDENLKFQ